MKLGKRMPIMRPRAAVFSTILLFTGFFILYMGAWIYLFLPIKAQGAFLLGSLTAAFGVVIIVIGISSLYTSLTKPKEEPPP